MNKNQRYKNFENPQDNNNIIWYTTRDPYSPYKYNLTLSQILTSNCQKISTCHLFRLQQLSKNFHMVIYFDFVVLVLTTQNDLLDLSSTYSKTLNKSKIPILINPKTLCSLIYLYLNLNSIIVIIPLTQNIIHMNITNAQI